MDPRSSADDVYRRQGFGQSAGFGRKPAVVVVDFTESFVDPAQFGGGAIADAIAATAHLLAAARDAGWPIAYSRVVYAEDGSDAGPFARKVPGLPSQTDESPATRVVDGLTPARRDLVVRKTAPSAFFGTGLLPWLVARGVDTLNVTGATTSGCVRATVVDPVSHGFTTVVPVDCVGDRSEAPRRASLFDMGRKYADLVTSADMIETARASPERPR